MQLETEDATLSLFIHTVRKVQSWDVTHAPWYQSLSPDHHLIQEYKNISHQDSAENLSKPSTKFLPILEGPP